MKCTLSSAHQKNKLSRTSNANSPIATIVVPEMLGLSFKCNANQPQVLYEL